MNTDLVTVLALYAVVGLILLLVKWLQVRSDRRYWAQRAEQKKRSAAYLAELRRRDAERGDPR